MLKVITLAVVLGVGQTGALAQMPLRLEDAQKRAIEYNQMLRASEAEVEQAQARKMQTWAGHLPHVKLSESGMRTNDAVNAFGVRLRQERFTQADFDVGVLNAPPAITNFETLIEVQQPLFNGGQAIYGRKAAAAAQNASEGQFQRHQHLVKFQTAQAYWGAVLAQEALEAVRLGLETAKQHAENTQLRYQEETADLADVLAARVRVAELEGQELTAKNEVAAAYDGLAIVMGSDFDIEMTLLDSLVRKPVSFELANLIMAAQKSRPDLRASWHQERAAGYQVGVARAEMLPKVNAFAQVALDAQDPFQRDGERWMVGGQVSWALFSGGKTLGKVREAKAARAGAQAAAEFKRADVTREVRAAYRQVTAANAQVDIAQRAVGHAEERMRIAQLQYREGLSTSLDLLTAESELRRARVQLLRAFYDLNVGLADLELTVGQPIIEIN